MSKAECEILNKSTQFSIQHLASAFPLYITIPPSTQITWPVM
jgi:hypothetical protein